MDFGLLSESEAFLHSLVFIKAVEDSITAAVLGSVCDKSLYCLLIGLVLASNPNSLGLVYTL